MVANAALKISFASLLLQGDCLVKQHPEQLFAIQQGVNLGAELSLPTWRREGASEAEQTTNFFKNLLKDVPAPEGCINRFAFFHIPKTGGRAVARALSSFTMASMGLTSTLDAGGLASRDSPTVTQEGREAYVVEFHTTEPRAAAVLKELKEKQYEDGCRVVTGVVLREPVERDVSMLDYDMQTGCLPQEARDHAKELFDMVADTQSRFLSESKYCPVCDDFWNGNHCSEVKMTQEEHEINMKMLEEDFDVVGLNSEMDEFGKKVLREMGFASEAIEHFTVPEYGVTSEPTDQAMASISDEALEAVKRQGKYDFELYNKAVELAHGE